MKILIGDQSLKCEISKLEKENKELIKERDYFKKCYERFYKSHNELVRKHYSLQKDRDNLRNIIEKLPNFKGWCNPCDGSPHQPMFDEVENCETLLVVIKRLEREKEALKCENRALERHNSLIVERNGKLLEQNNYFGGEFTKQKEKADILSSENRTLKSVKAELNALEKQTGVSMDKVHSYGGRTYYTPSFTGLIKENHYLNNDKSRLTSQRDEYKRKYEELKQNSWSLF